MTSDDPPIRLAHEAAFSLGGMTVTPATRQAAWAGQERTLEPRVMQVLVVLAGARGAVVGRDDLIQRCWDGRVVGDNAINRVISILRQLGAETGAFSLETVTKVGYRLRETGAPSMDSQAPPARRSRRWIAVAATFAVLATGLLGWWWVGRDGGLPRDQTGRVEVAPFQLRQGDAELARLSTDLDEALVRVLTRSGIDTVRAGSAAPAELRVTGSIGRQGDDVSISIEVLDRKSGVVLSSRQLTRPAAAAAHGLADRAALSVAGGLDCALTDRRQSRRGMAPSILALYLNTCEAVASEGNAQRMLQSGRRLTEAAPDLAVGQALFAVAQAHAAAETTLDAPEGEALRRAARASAARALQLDPRTPKAYLAIADSYPSGGHWLEREDNLIKARRIDPNLMPTRMLDIALLREVGRLKEAQEVDDQLIESGDPRTLNPALAQRIYIDGARGDASGARRALAQFAISRPESVGGIGWLLVSAWEEPGPALAHMREMDPHGPYNPQTFACVETFLSELPERLARHARGLPPACDSVPAERRLQMLSREGDVDGAYAEAPTTLAGPELFLGYLFYSSMKAFRDDPRFLPLAARLGLLDYWRRSGHWPDFCAEPGLPYACRKTQP